MSLSFAERLSKIKKNNKPISPHHKQRANPEKLGVPVYSKKINDFQQHHSDLKDMLQMLECERTNQVLFTPKKHKQEHSPAKFMDKIKTEGTSTKENSKKPQSMRLSPDKKLKIRFKNFEEETSAFEGKNQSLLLKNLNYKNKRFKLEEEQPKDPQKANSHKKVNQSGKRGIPNIGNTCYMNAVLQCLFHLKDFNPSLRCPIDEAKYPVTMKYLSLFNGVMNSRETKPDLSTMPLKKSVSKMCCLFMDFEQEDAHEFLKQLLDSVHKEGNRVKNYGAYRELDFSDNRQNLQALSHEYWSEYKKVDDSYIYDSLCGQVCNFVTCVNCKNTSVNFDNFLDLSLPLVKGHDSLEGILQEYFGEESLSDFYRCSKCGKSSKRSTKRSELWRCPNYLIIHLKRSQFGKKNQDRIKIPVKCLNMKPYMSSTQKPVSCKYNLQGVVLHRGRINGGHYWADIKDGSQWHSADDESLTNHSMAHIAETYEEKGSENAYILFYRSI